MSLKFKSYLLKCDLKTELDSTKESNSHKGLVETFPHST